jgi:hypothetical protein
MHALQDGSFGDPARDRDRVDDEIDRTVDERTRKDVRMTIASTFDGVRPTTATDATP